MLAEMFIKMLPTTGWPSGISGKRRFEHRAEESRHKLDDATAFADLHHAHPKRQYAGESERNFKSRLRRFESRVHNGRKDIEIAHEQEAKGGNDEGDEKKAIQI